jgi:hypothetical protein
MLLRNIARGYAAFYADNVWTQEVRDTPTRILKALTQAGQPVDISIYYPTYGSNGHSMLAYDVQDKGDGIYHIMVYDNNRPGEENFIVVDTNADTWYYAKGATNPNQATLGYQGDANTQTLAFVPLSAYDQPLECPAELGRICGENRFSVITITGNAQGVASTDNGRIGKVAGSVINTVNGGKLLPTRGELYSREQPTLLIPIDQPFSLEAQGTQDNQKANIIISSSFTVSLNGLFMQSGQIEQINVDPMQQRVSFVSGGDQSPDIIITYETGETSYQVQINGIRFAAGQSLAIVVDSENGDLSFESSKGLKNIAAVLTIVRVGVQKDAVFSNADFTILTGGTTTLLLGKWDGAGSPQISIDKDQDGTPETTIPLASQPLTTTLPAITNTTAMLQNIRRLTPYLGDKAFTDVVELLPTLSFSPSGLGKAYRDIFSMRPELQNDAAALADAFVQVTVSTAQARNLTPDALGKLLANMHLEQDTINDALDTLDLSEADRFQVESILSEQEAVFNALADWNALNIAEPNTQTFADFLEQKALNDDQIFAVATNANMPDEVRQAARAPYIEAVAEKLGNVCSSPGSQTTITFVNDTPSTVVFYWVDFNCEEQFQQPLLPRQGTTWRTYIGHVFRAYDKSSGAPLLLQTPNGLSILYTVDMLDPIIHIVP